MVLRKGLIWSSRFALENASLLGGGVHIVLENVPAGEDQIVEPGQREELLDLGRAGVGALAQADGSHLGERADGLGNSFAHGFDAGHKRGGYRAHARDHDPELAFG